MPKGKTMAIYHGIRFSVRPGVTGEAVAAGLAAMRDAARATPAVTSFVVGRDFGGDYDYGAVSVVADLVGYAEMMNHPAHLEVDRAGLPLIERFASFDVSDDPDPELGARIAEIHRSRYAANPDVADLVSDLDDHRGSGAPGGSAS
ncbi:Stress responsive alpha-beta barrel domain protein [Actinosynnema mirum DSM 43827]|uniref:Stress responsive alpha-beta barrel domain protein n=2 Tax=Actinosynnema mirum TaxID=40567 RepID=C6WK63_ACTMD|nr:Stress responsive alpha-beta barrel domain protein [Actinosynnema mirum DSM 43827]